MTTDKQPLEELQKEGVRLLTLYKGTPEDERTPILRMLAKVLVSARSAFTNDDGDPDYKGLTYEYRHWVHKVYDQAHFQREERALVQAAVRYHAGNILREVLDDETIERIGLMKATPKQRAAARRISRNTLLNGLAAERMRHGDMLALSAAFSMIENITGNDFADLDFAERRLVERSLTEIGRRVESLKRLLETLTTPEELHADADGPDYEADE